MSQIETPESIEEKSWLQRLKDESWEAELLVSAVAIFGTFQLFAFSEWLSNFFINNLQPVQYKLAYTITYFTILAFSILVVMFVIHFVLRAYWIGVVGLNSVFPEYGNDSTLYNPKMMDKIKH